MKVPYLALGWQAAGTRMVAKHSGGQAFVELLDASNFQLLTQAQVHTFYGGPMSGAEWEFEIPYDDSWYIAGAGDGQLQVDQLMPGMPPMALEGVGATVLEGEAGRTADQAFGAQAGRESEVKSVEFQSGKAPRDVTAGTGGGLARGPGREPPPPMTDNRRKAIEYADMWAEGNNPKYKDFGVGKECTNFVSQALRAGMFQDTQPGIGDVHGGDRDDWYYQNHMSMRGGVDVVWGDRPWSDTWALAKANHDFITQHSGRGNIVGVLKIPPSEQYEDGKPLPDKRALNPTALSDAGLIPGDVVYYKEGRYGDDPDEISHVAMFVGQRDLWDEDKKKLVRTDVVDQHAIPGINYRNDWQPDGSLYTEGQVEFVHLTYPGE